MRNSSRQVTDNCKYYYIYGCPVNIAYIYDSAPFYDTEDIYYVQSYYELQALLNKVGLEEVKKFVNGICNIKVMGSVDADLMLKQIHQFSTNQDRNTAFRDYNTWLRSQKYTHLQPDDAGDLHRVQCTRFMAHSEFGTNMEPQVEYTIRDKKTRSVKVYIQSYPNMNEEL